MKDISSIDVKRFETRARLPKYFRIAAVVFLLAVLLAVGVGFYLARSNSEFRMTGFPTSLSKDVIATVSSYERREIDGDAVKYYIKADRAVTFTDNHQELENVYLQVFDDEGSYNEITAAKAVYVPAENKNFTGYFAGDVKITTRDQFRLRTEQISYTKATDTATSEEVVTFERSNIRGSSFGAVVKMTERSVELQRDVHFEIARADGNDKLTAGNAVYRQNTGVLELTGGSSFVSRAASHSIDGSSNRAIITLVAIEGQPYELKTAELFENVSFAKITGADSTKITAANGSYEKPSDRMDVMGNVVIESQSSGQVVRRITGDGAFYTTKGARAEIVGNVQVTAGLDVVKGDRIDGDLSPNGAFKKVVVTGSAFLRQVRDRETTEAVSDKLTVELDEKGDIVAAAATGKSEILQVSKNPTGLQNVRVSAASGIDAAFRGPGSFERIRTNGRTTIDLVTPDNGVDSSNKQVSADQVVSSFNADGKSFKRTEAIGNAEFLIAPHRAALTNYRVKVNGPRFDCDFFASGNALSVCVAASGAKMIRTPTVDREGRGEQIVTANTLTTRFEQTGGNISLMEAAGKAKFSELDRSSSSNTFTFTANDEVIRLRGGEPTGWDSRARVKAREIDWDTRNSRSHYRGAASSTYYSSRGLGNSSPFGKKDKPVFVTSDTAEMDHNAETAHYSGNARAWQGATYVRAETLTVSQKDSKLNAEGNVQSSIFDGKTDDDSGVPVFVAASKMLYDGEKRTVRYDHNVVARKGPDRINGRMAIAWFDESNEMTAIDFENDVVITQPGRKSNADYARYTSSDEKLVLRGRPARIDDPEKGSLAGSELTIFLKDKRVFGVGPSQENPTGRVRNTYKIQ